MRTVDISKANHSFAHHAHIATAVRAIFQQLANEKHLAELNPNAFSNRAAYYLGEINAVHPFREGNGRAQREFMSHLAHANQYYLAWENTFPHEVLQAAIESFSGNTKRLAAIINNNLESIRP